MKKEHFVAAKELWSRDDVLVREVDKTAAYVLIKKDEYLEKMDNILSDTSKFVKIKRNPTDEIKKKVNTTIKAINISSKK